jgi:hypothetical protein
MRQKRKRVFQMDNVRSKKCLYTKQVYGWERELSDFQHSLDLPMGKLRSWARDIWKKECLRKPMPKIVGGRGIWDTNKYASFSQGDLIVLARQHRSKLILLHEICHYLGRESEMDHGLAFQDRYAGLFFKHLV